MHLLLLGVSHRTAPVEVRERLDFQTRGVESALRELAEMAVTSEAAIVSTCNRAEVYARCPDLPATREALARFLASYHGIEAESLAPHLYHVSGLDAARHLFRVAAGLDSLVMGEPQVLGQVKGAHVAATAAHTSGPVLNRLFHASFAVGKRVRTETALGAGAVSVGFAAVSLAKKIFGDLTDRNVLVVGAGEMGKLTARHMKSQGVRQITIVSRTMANAARTAEMIGGATAARLDDLDSLLTSADIVITATGASTPILTKARVERIMRPRRGRPLFVIDIALPRDVDSAVGELGEVFLYNVDDLQATVRENLARRASEVERAEQIVAEEVEKFGQWLHSRRAIPTVVALRQRFDNIRRAELERLTMGMPADVRERVEDVTRLIVEKLLLTPTERLKGLRDPELITAYAEAVNRLFGLDSARSASDGASTNTENTDRRHKKVEPFVRPGTR